MKDDKRLERLIALARRGRAAPPEEAPFGFTTRVTALSLVAPREDTLFVWERLARWGVTAAIAVCVLTASLHHRAPKHHSSLAEFAGLNESTEGF